MTELLLLTDATSPFGRKVLVAALERSVPIQEEFVNVYEPGKQDDFNPLRQIPVLVTKKHAAIYDSDNILLYVDASHTGAPLIPPERRWEVLTRVSLANGLMEATLQRVMELRRPDAERSTTFVRRMEERIWRALTKIDSMVESPSDEPLTADQIAVAVALAYVDFRFSTEWQTKFRRTAGWSAQMSRRDSMMRTVPTRSAPLDEIRS